MNLCDNCSAVLPEGFEGLCPECGAEQKRGHGNAYAHTNAASHTRQAKHGTKPRSTRLLTALVVAAIFLCVVLAGTSIATTVFHNKYNAADAVNTIGAALLAGDITGLRELVAGDGIEVSDAGLKALCRAFSTQEAVDALKSQLHTQITAAKDSSVTSLPYPALSPLQKPVFLGYGTYQLLAKGVSLQIPGTIISPLLTVDGQTRTGTSNENGILYANFFPGVYTCAVSGTSVTNVRVDGTPVDVVLLNASAPIQWGGALPLSTVTISGAIADDATIDVNGVAVEQKPVNGVVTLPNVPVGSTISYSSTTSYGAVKKAFVVFADAAQTNLAFGELAISGGLPSEEQANSLLGSYYASYLAGINSKNGDGLAACSETFKAALIPTLTSADNSGKTFVFTSAAVNPASITYQSHEPPLILCNVKFDMSFTEDKKDSTRTLYQTCELIWQDSAWFVNRVVDIDVDSYNAGTYGSLG